MEKKDTLSAQYLTFTIQKIIYGFRIEYVREVLDYSFITHVPGMPEYISGIINVRGSIVPVLDLKIKFNGNANQRNSDNNESIIIVLDLPLEDKKIPMGIKSETVEEVLYLDPKDIDPPPETGCDNKEKYLSGVGKKKDCFILLLNPLELVNGRDIKQIEGQV